MRSEPISVIIPSFNHEKYVVKAIESVLGQSYPNIELIIIDDGSSDKSVAVIEKLITAKRGRRGRKILFEAQKNLGAHLTINRGLGMATGSYLTILNSDDFYFPERLELMRVALKRNKSDLAFSYVRHIDSVGTKLGDDHFERKWYVEALTRANIPSVGFRLLLANIGVTTGNFFFSRALYEKTGGFRDFILMHDYDFLLRSLFFTEPVLLKKELMAYRVHPKNTFRKYSNLQFEEGLRVTHDFFKQSILDQKPKNKLAPCPLYWRGQYIEFFKTQHSWLANWLPGVREIATSSDL